MRLHITNLSPRVTEDQLRSLFGQHGDVLYLELAWVQSVGRTTGTAIVDMHPAQAMTAMSNLNGRPFRNRRLYIAVLDKVRPQFADVKKATA